MSTTEYLMIRRAGGTRKSRHIAFEKSVYDRSVIRILRDGIPLGSFSLLPYSNGDIYFYDFSLFPEYRYGGTGTAVFPSVISYLTSLGYKNIRLQVSSSNPAALALYRHYGFSVLESVII